MQVREVVIRNFRSIKHMTWKPGTSLVCLLGRGDVGKSSVLDAIEFALSPRPWQFSDTDFFGADTTGEIDIFVTVGELSEVALDDRRFGHYLRGWTKGGMLRDEPQEDDEPVVTVRLTVDTSLEGEWTLHTDRHEPKTLSSRERILFGVVRLGQEVERHLTWGRHTALSAVTDDRGPAAVMLAHAFRAARDHVTNSGLPGLAATVDAVTAEARRLGAYCAGPYRAGLDVDGKARSLSGIAVHDGSVPLRLAGLGTRRLVSLAIQQMSVEAGAIVLIDEIEHGLEPHRIRHALKVLRDKVDPPARTDADPKVQVDPPAGADADAKGQVFLTTHSHTTLVELGCRYLAICNSNDGVLSIRTPSSEIQGLLRRVPEAFLARRVLVCEGSTEIGIIRGLRDTWNRHQAFPFEALGAWLADGNGSQSVSTAVELASLGYAVALFRDSDISLDGSDLARLVAAGIEIYEWDSALATEQRIFRDASRGIVQQLLELAYTAHGESRILREVACTLGVAELPGPNFGDWRTLGKAEDELRDALGKAAKRKREPAGSKRAGGGWYKSVSQAEVVGLMLGSEIRRAPDTPLARLLRKVEAWLHA